MRSDKKAMSKTMKNYWQENARPVIEGKEHMSFKCYQLSCKLLIEAGSYDSVSALYFSTIHLNLIWRSETMENIFLRQMKWENDHLKIYFPKHKFDQIRLNKDEARNVYSNPNDPAVCPPTCIGI